VRVQDSLKQYSTPRNFPNKVVKFWRLQRPRHQPHLVELLRFYHIQASDLTTSTLEDNDDTESERSSESSLTLEEAVKANPTFAFSSLSSTFGT
jgi:hypothetical protein